MQCRYVVANFLQNPPKRTIFFVNTNIDFSSTSVHTVLYAISYYSGPRCKGTRLWFARYILGSVPEWLTQETDPYVGEVASHDDVMKFKHFPHHWPSVWGIHRSPVDSPHKRQWWGTLIFPFISVCANFCTNSRQTREYRCLGGHLMSL